MWTEGLKFCCFFGLKLGWWKCAEGDRRASHGEVEFVEIASQNWNLNQVKMCPK